MGTVKNSISSENMIDHQSYALKLSSCEIKAWRILHHLQVDELTKCITVMIICLHLFLHGSLHI